MPRVKLFNEEEVLQKAMLLFWKKGYYNTSIQDLVKNLGINRASLYDTFGGKKQLFDKAFEAYRMTNNYGLNNFLKQQNEVKKGLRIVFEKVITDDALDTESKGCFIVNTTTELVASDKALENIIYQHQKNMEITFFNFLKKGVDNGEIPSDKNLMVIANLLYTLMTGLRVVGKIKSEKTMSLASVDAVLSLLD
jgi:TetR/AcrR family transcriptional repressor of nem operon